MSVLKSFILIVFIIAQGYSYAQIKEYEGVYSYGNNLDSGSIGIAFIYPNSDSTLLFHLDLNRGAPSYNNGTLSAEIKLNKKGEGNFSRTDDDYMNCHLQFRFKNDTLFIKTINGAYECGYGHSVYSDGVFIKSKNKTLKDYMYKDLDSTHMNVLNWQSLWTH